MTIRLINGRTKRLTIKLMHNDEPYVPLDTETVRLTIKRFISSKEPVISKTGTEILIEPKETADLDTGSYVYDVVLERSNGDIYTVIPSTAAHGTCIIERGVYANE